MADHEPAAPVPGDGGFVRLRLDVAYDGSDFAGFAKQPHLRTVQGELEKVIAMVMRLPAFPVTGCAGRTDAGVHARGQVVQVDVRSQDWIANGSDPHALLRRLSGALPRDLRVHAATVAARGFDARFSATWRRYVYRVCDHISGPDPLRRAEVLWHRRDLDVERLQQAADVLVGQHDFAAFCRLREGATTIRVLDLFRWERVQGPLVTATLVADAFCHSMVRSIVGACLAVGDGRREPEWVLDVLEGRQRVSEVQVAAPRGLTLEGVGYPPDAELAVRAEVTRNRRAILPLAAPSAPPR